MNIWNASEVSDNSFLVSTNFLLEICYRKLVAKMLNFQFYSIFISKI